MSVFGKKSRLVLGPLLGCLGLLVLFFSVTDPTTWPQRTTLLASTDMKIAPLMSTVWCESVVLLSEHDFIAYRVSKTPPLATRLTRNTVGPETLDFGTLKLRTMELKYYLLGGSVISVDACASETKSYVRIYRGKVSQSCLRHSPESEDSSESDSDESDEEIDIGWQNASQKRREQLDCPKPIRFRTIPATYREETPCTGLSLTAVVDRTDDYVIFFYSDNPVTNRIRLTVTLDRTTYNVNESRRSMHMCTADSVCVVPLSFASLEKLVLWIPKESMAGSNQFAIHSRCRPRIEFFAVLTILLPTTLLFSVVCIVVRSKEARLQNRYVCNMPYQDRSAPLLVGFRDVEAEGDADHPCLSRRGSDPPSYDMVIAQTPPPPPYSSLKLG